MDNYYIDGYRIVHIANAWRVCAQDKDNCNKWNFINDTIYKTQFDAIDAVYSLKG